ncbi:MAG: ATP-binding protein [Thiomargarita sp.]|nr:ATP-binding protein [Bacteroidales bacterium]MCK5720110.1 ATP-binding protein [Thiomargarita sp.]
MNTGFANLIIKYMEREKFTDSTLADCLNVKRETIFRWRKGNIRSPKYDTVIESANVFNLNPIERNEFFTAAGWPDPEAKLVVNEQGEYSSQNTKVVIEKDVRPKKAAAEINKEVKYKLRRNITPITTRPINNTKQFFGRKVLLKQIFNFWKTKPLEHLLITGPRRSGKTSFLNQILNNSHKLKQKTDWLFIDFDNVRMQRSETLVEYILTQLKLDKGSCDLIDLTIQLEENLKRPVIIIMDNVESGFKSPDLDSAFWKTIRFLGNHVEKIGFCVSSHASSLELEKIAEENGNLSPIYSYEEIKLGPLTEDESRTFLQALSIKNKDFTWIIDKSRAWPILLQEMVKIYLANKSGKEWQKLALNKIERYKYLK